MPGVIEQLSTRVVQMRPAAEAIADARVATATSAAPASPVDHGASVPLASLPVGATAVLAGFAPSLRPEVARRLFDLGFVPGTTVVVARRAPMKDPVIYRVGGIEVALRASEAGGVLAESADPADRDDHQLSQRRTTRFVAPVARAS